VRAPEPIRTCTGCGGRAPQRTLVRFVTTGGRLQLDERRSAPGRGAYLHRASDCWTAFVRRRGQIRSLRSSPPPSERERLVAMLAGDAAAKVER
jgi:predicted RNA-binding protein YlxR (DUF448 family)